MSARQRRGVAVSHARAEGPPELCDPHTQEEEEANMTRRKDWEVGIEPTSAEQRKHGERAARHREAEETLDELFGTESAPERGTEHRQYDPEKECPHGELLECPECYQGEGS